MSQEGTTVDSNDKKSIGLTPESKSRLSEIEAKGWFAQDADIARFCMAYAIRAKVPIGETRGATTTWAAGNFDEGGDIRAILRALYPNCEKPVQLMEFLVNAGIDLVHRRITQDQAGPVELLGG